MTETVVGHAFGRWDIQRSQDIDPVTVLDQGSPDPGTTMFARADRATRSRIVNGLGGRAAIALGSLVITLSLLQSHGRDANLVALAVGMFAIVTGAVMLTFSTAIPMPAGDALLVSADLILFGVGSYSGALQTALPAIFVVIGTILFAIRPWQVVAVHFSLVGLAYAGILAFGPREYAPTARWLAVMTTVIAGGMFIRWLTATVAGLALQERAAHQAAVAATRQLGRVSEAKSAFLARMSHELRTPLNVVLGFGEVLEAELVGPLTDVQREYVADITGSARHLTALIGDVLDLSKIEHGDTDLDRRPVDLRAVLDDAIGMVRGKADAAALTLRLESPSSLGMILADERKLRQVVVNLLTNAVKFTRPGGTVTVTAWRVRGRVHVEVTDTGIGIAEADHDRIFERYTHLTDNADSVGLGLPLARHLVERHGGRLRLHSQPGQGSTFGFELPTHDLHEPEAVGELAPADLDSDYSAFTVPGSAANRALVSWIGMWLLGGGGVLLALLGIATPVDSIDRIALIGSGALLAATVATFGRRLSGRPMVHVEISGWLAIAGISVATYFCGGLTDVMPLAYGCVTMPAFALWRRRRAVAMVVGIAIGYGIELGVAGRPDAPEHWLAIMVMLGYNGQTVSWVTDRLRRLVVDEQSAHRSARQLRMQLTVVSSHKSVFLANMSHELRTPLNAVIGFADLLSAELVGPLNERQHEFCADIVAAAQHLLALINDVLDMAQLEAGQLRLNLEPVGVRALVANSIRLAEATTAERRVIEVEIDACVTTVIGDRHRLEQMCSHLIANATRFTTPSQRIWVRASHPSDHELHLAVRDSGAGIAPEHADLIFEAFHQGTAASVSGSGGTGLGLALTRGLAHLHGGGIWVVSRPGEGSTFTISLPRQRVRVQGEADVVAPGARSGGAR